MDGFGFANWISPFSFRKSIQALKFLCFVSSPQWCFYRTHSCWLFTWLMVALSRRRPGPCPVWPARSTNLSATVSLAHWLNLLTGWPTDLFPGWQSGVTVDLCCWATVITQGRHNELPMWRGSITAHCVNVFPWNWKVTVSLSMTDAFIKYPIVKLSKGGF